MEIFSFLIGVGIVLLILIVPLGMIAIGTALFAGAAKTMHDIVKGKK